MTSKDLKTFLLWLVIWFGSGFLLEYAFRYNIILGLALTVVLTGSLIYYFSPKRVTK